MTPIQCASGERSPRNHADGLKLMFGDKGLRGLGMEPSESDPVLKGAYGKALSEDEAFDLWLKKGLHQLFDDIANEPLPAELLRLIEDDRNR